MIPESCKDCPKKKTVHLTQILESGMKKYDVCEDCPVASKFQDPVFIKSLEKFSNIKGKGSSEQAGEPIESQKTGGNDGLVCPTCKYTEDSFNKNGRLGCPHCYEIFQENINKILPEMHRGTAHRGKVPAHLESSIRKENQIQALEKDLQEAIRIENFEEAAKLRDSLRSLRDDSSNPTA